jgi:hypothetical protein
MPFIFPINIFLPESSSAIVSPIVFPGDSPGDKMHAPGDGIAFSLIHREKMNMIAGDDIIQYCNFETRESSTDPKQPALSILVISEEEFTVMTSLSDVPDKPWKKMALGSGHGRFLFRRRILAFFLSFKASFQAEIKSI